MGLGAQGLDFKLFTPGVGFEPSSDAVAATADEQLLDAARGKYQIEVLLGIGVGAGDEPQGNTSGVENIPLVAGVLKFKQHFAGSRLANLGVVKANLLELTSELLRADSGHQPAGAAACQFTRQRR